MRHAILARPFTSLARSLAFLACSGIAAANTWIVDAAGGPGHHFTAIQPAIAAAAPGDLILVRQGIYAPFTLDKGLTVMGELPAVPRFDGVVTVSQIAPGERAALVGFTVHPWQGVSKLNINQCGGFVLVQESKVRALDVTASVDVRVDHLTSGPGFVQGSRFEASASSFQGIEGEYGLGVNGGAGSAGIWGYNQARLHLALTSALGGAGGGASYPSSAGDGGPGVRLSDSQGLLFGAGHLIKGGFAGDGGQCSMDGYPGPGC